MNECCAPSASATAAIDAAAPATRVSTGLSWRDRLGMLRMRLNVGRGRYRVAPGLYRAGEPGPESPVLVTANYRYSFDLVRSSLAGLDVWLLVLDTAGINVWCAAGKNKLTTTVVAEHVIRYRLADLVTHRTLVLPQLAAPGVAAHDVKAFTGFRVIYGPVRADDIPGYLAAGMKATPEMRRVHFGLWDRFVLTGVELSMAWRPVTLLALLAIVALSGFGAWGFSVAALLGRGSVAIFALLGGLFSGAVVMPLLLPWLPFRMFAAKGAVVGGVVGLALGATSAGTLGSLAAASAGVALGVAASYVAMNFTGSSPIASPSGVLVEMRRWLPWQVGLGAVAVIGWISSAFVGKGW